MVVTELDLNQLCREAVRLLQHDAVRRNTRLQLSLAPTAQMVTGDSVQLQQVLLNLLLNGLDAASMSATERFVAIATESSADDVEVSVQDSGPGLPPAVAG